MAIDYQRPEFEAALPKWALVDDMTDETNLPDHLVTLNPADTSADNKTRNEQYAERASFLGATGFTLAGLTGTAFEDAPTIELPKGLDYLATNADGQGLGLQQQMQVTLGQVLRKDRAGLFVTFPETEGDVSRADQDALRYVATVHAIDARRIINWRYETIGAESRLALVVFTDTAETVEDYEVKQTDILRELALENGAFVDRKWHKANDSAQWAILSEHMPRQGNGAHWAEIPFTFVGAKDNSAQFGTPPMYSLAKLNRDHWRTSADHRESLWFAGQVQPWAANVDQETVDQWKKAGVYIGSRQLLTLPEGGQFGFAQSDPNTANRDELDRLEDAMAKIGARFIEPGSANKTAQQDAGERKVQHSILSLASVNVQDAYQSACEWAANYMNVTGEISIELSRGFMEPEINDAKRAYILGLYDRGLLGDVDMLPTLKRDGLVAPEKTIEDFAEEAAGRVSGADA
jgi:hypothetical protein